MTSQKTKQRRLLCFLLLTVGVMLVELLYGIAVNSLGLVSDAFHMMLDAVSIVIGLYAAHAASWAPAPPSHPFGYGRYEALGGFVNGVLLVFIALYVLQESVQRLVHPPEIHGSFLLTVSVVGLIVNVIGVVFFHEAGHGHAHGSGDDDGHRHGCCAHDRVDHNLRAVYLHIVADLLGSVNVIVSSTLIRLFGLWIADPICSVVSALFILLSALPLLQQTGTLLLLAGPPTGEGAAVTHKLRGELERLDALAAVDTPIVWQHASSAHALLFCAVTGKLKSGADYRSALRAIKRTARTMLAESSAVDDVRVIVTLE